MIKIKVEIDMGTGEFRHRSKTFFLEEGFDEIDRLHTIKEVKAYLEKELVEVKKR